MIFVLEHDRRGGFRLRPQRERIGALNRLIWGWWAIALLPGGINDLFRVFRNDGLEKVADRLRIIESEPMAVGEPAESVQLGRLQVVDDIRAEIEWTES